MKLLHLIQRKTEPQPWSEGEKIPWNEPGFSQRMLKEHLSQEHDAASRRSGIIDQHVDWIHCQILATKPARILDLGCGPGLYSNRLAKLGHRCSGIDFSPASIAYAKAQAQAEELENDYRLGDIRQVDYGGPYDLAMLIFGEFNVFRPVDAGAILQKAWRSLKLGGVLLLEPHTFEAVASIGKAPASWYSTESGLFLDRPHLCLQENFWNEEQQAATTRYYIVDAKSATTSQHAMSMQAYTMDGYKLLLHNNGFDETQFFPGLGDSQDAYHSELIAIAARKTAS